MFLGASGAMSNGTVIARAGSAPVAMMADSMQRPVIICCETLKFHERVQLDSITSNELGDPDAMASVPGRAEITDLQGWRDNPKLGEVLPGQSDLCSPLFIVGRNAGAGTILSCRFRVSQRAQFGPWDISVQC